MTFPQLHLLIGGSIEADLEANQLNSMCRAAAPDGWSETSKRDSIFIVRVTSCHG